MHAIQASSVRSLFCSVVILLALSNLKIDANEPNPSASLAAHASLSHSRDFLQDEDDELGQGLMGRYVDKTGHSVQRIDSVISFAWRDTMADPRLKRGAFKSVWKGYLLSDSPGEYQFSAHVEGKLTIKLRDQVIIDEAMDRLKMVKAKPIELPFDWHPIEITFESNSRSPRLALYWNGPGFQQEPIGYRQFYHERADSPDESWRRGRDLVTQLRCGACHSLPSSPTMTPGPDLTHLAGNLYSPWTENWLSGHEAQTKVASGLVRKMPAFGFDEAQSKALTAFLLKGNQPKFQPQTAKKSDLEKGHLLVVSLGCLACHQLDSVGNNGLYGGGDLTEIAAKRPTSFFETWLASPAKLNQQHQMPVFDLSSTERKLVSRFLSSLGSPDTSARIEKHKRGGNQQTSAELVATGEKLFRSNRCDACHSTEPQDAVALPTPKQWQKSCLGTPDVGSNRPGYGLSQSDQLAVKTFFEQTNPEKLAEADSLESTPKIGSGHRWSQSDREQLIARLNCLSCHPRGSSAGIKETLTDLAAAHPTLAESVPAMTPPSLNSIGDKLLHESLEQVIGQKVPGLRPYLDVRMPRFDLSDEQLSDLAQYLVDQDRLFGTEATPFDDKNTPEYRIAGTRLVTSAGFGCTSCHQIGKVPPPDGPINARGPDISMLGQRIRRSWFDRWVKNPTRIVRGQEMPSVQVAVGGVLGNDIDRQLSSVWSVLNIEGFQPPIPNAIRTVRHRGIQYDQPSHVLTDVFREDTEAVIKPFVVGLSNRHNVMFDLQTNRLRKWWIGDTAGQHTDRKFWYWSTAGSNLFSDQSQESDINLIVDGNIVAPQKQSQFVTSVDQWQHHGNELLMNYRIHFPPKSFGENSIAFVKQRLAPLVADNAAGWSRELIVEGLPKGRSLQFLGYKGALLSSSILTEDRKTLTFGSPEITSIQIIGPKGATFDTTGGIILAAPADDAPIKLVLHYHTALPVDQYDLPVPEVQAPPIRQMDVVPGFEAIRLPIAQDWMPTGLAWRPDGSMIITSLKGQVWSVKDTDGDGLEETVALFGDDLAAPFGAHGHEDYVDVINKYALLRLHDADHDGFVERTENIASGWGHTQDYHDWAIGLPKDKAGNYYISTACQQDDRELAAAFLRGKMIQLRPRTADSTDPRLFENHLISGGHRFPIGIAQNRSGELFVSDNQGNYNPFNELNHVRQDLRFGFINKSELSESFRPKLSEPAINIPHPWTRSVNGICFLETPEKLLRANSQTLFGPFEGHLVGCEMDSQRLIRMSLQRVGDTFQGAAYPFSYELPKSGEPLLGPITCGVAPDGDLYIGSLRDSGWGGANNIGTLVRMRPKYDELPTGIAEVTSNSRGFDIRFTRPVEPQLSLDLNNYLISSYRRVSTPAYGGDDVDRRTESVVGAKLSDDGMSVQIQMKELRAGFVYELRLKNLSNNKVFFPAEAHYSLNQIPE